MSGTSERFWKYIGVTVAIALAAYLFVWSQDRPPKKQNAIAATMREPAVVSVLRINESETIKTLSVPDPMLSDPLFDTRCLIYTNQELRQSAIRCLSRPGGPE